MSTQKLKLDMDLIKDKFHLYRNFVWNWIKDLAPSPGAERGAVITVGFIVIFVGTTLGVTIRSGFGLFLDFSLSLLASLFGYVLAILLVKIGLAILRKIPAGITAALISGWMIVIILFEGIPWETIWFIAAGVVLIEILLGILMYEFLKGGWQSAKFHKRILLLVCTLLVVGGNMGIVAWLVHPGVDDYLLMVEPFQGEPTIQGSNPSEPGPYPVNTLVYGSGVDRRRPEFGEDVNIVTTSVDGTSFFWLNKWEGIIRKWYWGFEPDELPLNGRVWYPDGEGPFPLVLMVHGNHYMIETSDTGYDYLGELLASRGYIFVSVDENFLNGYLIGSVNWENDTRGWLLLKHLELWRSWSQSFDSPFEGLVDLDRIALIGHSRGGEAVAHAAAFNRLSHYPDNANVRWDFNFGIQSVVAIAPVDQQYQPADHATTLMDLNYLVLQGAHDADLSKFEGFQQYQRVYFTDPKSEMLKAGLYIYQANHSRFNSEWGERDFGGPRGYLLNQAPLLSPEEHRQIAQVFISAFLDVTLKGLDVYKPMFEDYRNAGAWLPSTLYINQYQDAGYLPLVNYEEDFDATTTTIEGGSLLGNNLSEWKEASIKFRTGKSQDNHAVMLGWNRNNSWYQITIPQNIFSGIKLDNKDQLVFNLVDGRGNVEGEVLLDFSIILKDSKGESASLKVSEVNDLLPQFPVQFTRLVILEEGKYKNPTEPVFQTFRLPLSKIQEINPQFRLDYLKEIRFAFDQVDAGEIILDEVGFDLN